MNDAADPSQPPSAPEPTDVTVGQPTVTHFDQPSGPEAVKAASHHLRGSLRTDIDDTGHGGVGHDSEVLLKFHGIYAQDDRDQRKALKAAAGDGAAAAKDNIFMVRASIPGGIVTASQWAAMDDLAGELGDASLRITTRQGIQWHFVRKGGLTPLIRTLNDHLLTTLAACGDVNRNVQCCPAPLADRRHDAQAAFARQLATRFRPQTRAYYDVWIDGEHAASASAPTVAASASAAPANEESLYGDTYLPRKFKMGIAWPGDNCIDVYANDLGFIPARHEQHGPGYVVVVGGGMGRAHNREDTYPRLASPLGWVPQQADERAAGDVAEAVITAFRDHGNREDRKRARLKYLIDDRGLEWFRSEVEARLGHRLVDPIDVAPWVEAEDHLGWFQQPDTTWSLGVPVNAGRVKDTDTSQVRTALRTIIDRWQLTVHLTARQDIILTGIAAQDRDGVEAILRQHGVALVEDLVPVRRLGMACPALPTCGQALAESERVLPDTLDTVHETLVAAGLGSLPVHVRMTGCPNGCARPYTAEIGIVGKTKTGYDVHLGGSAVGTRLNTKVAGSVKLEDLPSVIGPALERYRAERSTDETFGDFVHRVGTDQFVVAPKRRASASADEE